MRLERIEIIRLPGINPDAGFTIDTFDPQTNVIIGPNASGKSSVARAVRTLVDAGQHRGSDVHVVGTFSADDGPWQATRVGDRISWYHNGVPASAPALPHPRLLSCYTLCVEDLMAASATDGEIAERISRDLAGGYDLGAVRTAISVKSTIGLSEAKALTDAKQELDTTSGALRELKAQEDRFAGWEADLADARGAEANVRQCKNALDLVEAADHLHAIEQRRRQFPDAMHLLHGDESTRLGAMRVKVIDVEGKIAEANRRVVAARAQLKDSRLESSTLDRGSLDERLEEVKALQSFEHLVSQSTNELARARRALEAARKEIGVPDGAEAPDITPKTISGLEDLLSTKRQLDAKVAAVDEALEALPERNGEEELELSVAQRARYELMAWLSAPTIVEHHRAPLVAVLLMAGAGLIGIGALAYLSDWWYATLAVGVMIGAVLALRAVSTTTTDSAERQRSEQAFRRLGAMAPASWSEEEVGTHVTDLDKRVIAIERAQRASEMRFALQERLRSIEADRTEVERTLAGVAESVQFEYSALDAGLHRWAQRLKDYGDASASVAAAEVSLSQAGEGANRIRESLIDFLTEHGEAPDAFEPASGAFTSRLSTLRVRLEQRKQALAEIAAREQDGESLRLAFRELLDEIATLLQGAGVSPDTAAPDQALSHRLAALDDWRTLEQERNEGEAAIAHLRKLLQHDSRLLALAEGGDADTIRTALRRAEEMAASVHDLTQKIESFNARRNLAERQRGLELCRAKVQDAEERLRVRRDEAFFAEAGALLLDAVESEHDSVSRPAVLRQAEDWFARFTRHAFQIHFDRAAPDGQHFAAVETATGHRRALDELSTATKAQLLLAIRVAFTTMAEEGRTALPMFLDEALTTSDEMRFREVAQSLGLLARESGRQIVYLAAKGEDAAYWKIASGASCRVFDMAEIRLLGRRTMDLTALVLPDRPLTPAPDGMTPEAYAALLKVPPIDPSMDSAAIHMFHLLRDELPLLHRVVSLGSETVGALKSRLASPVGRTTLGAEAGATLARRIAAAEAWHAAASVGRGRRVDRRALIDCDLVTSTFLDRLHDVAIRSNGDAAAILEALDSREITHFRGRAQLEEWFHAHGYLTDQPPLEDHDVEDRIYAALQDPARDTDKELDEARMLRLALDFGVDGAASLEPAG